MKFLLMLIFFFKVRTVCEVERKLELYTIADISAALTDIIKEESFKALTFKPKDSELDSLNVSFKGKSFFDIRLKNGTKISMTNSKSPYFKSYHFLFVASMGSKKNTEVLKQKLRNAIAKFNSEFMSDDQVFEENFVENQISKQVKELFPAFELVKLPAGKSNVRTLSYRERNRKSYINILSIKNELGYVLEMKCGSLSNTIQLHFTNIRADLSSFKANLANCQSNSSKITSEFVKKSLRNLINNKDCLIENSEDSIEFTSLDHSAVRLEIKEPDPSEEDANNEQEAVKENKCSFYGTVITLMIFDYNEFSYLYVRFDHTQYKFEDLIHQDSHSDKNVIESLSEGIRDLRYKLQKIVDPKETKIELKTILEKFTDSYENLDDDAAMFNLKKVPFIRMKQYPPKEGFCLLEFRKPISPNFDNNPLLLDMIYKKEITQKDSLFINELVNNLKKQIQ